MSETEQQDEGRGMLPRPREHKNQMTSLPANLQSVQEIQRLVSELKSREQVLDVLINNAGAAWGESVDTHSVSTFLPRRYVSKRMYRMMALPKSLR